MARSRAGLVGRGGELAALRPDGSPSGPVLLRGGSGSGRTSVLAELGRELRATGTTVLDVGFEGRFPAWDRFGVHAVLDAVRERFEHLDARPGLAGSVNAVQSLCSPATYRSAARRSLLLVELSRMFGRIGASSDVAVLVDDVDAVAAPAMVLASAHRAAHHIVATCARDERHPGAAAALGAVADRVVDLRPLPDGDVDLLLRRAGAPVDPAVPRALRAALGPLYGNPAALLATVAELERRGRLVLTQGHLVLSADGGPIVLPPGHGPAAEVAAHAGLGRDLVVLAAGGAVFTVDDVPALAAATGRGRDECGRALDRMVHAGALAVDDRGRVTPGCPALGAAVVETAGPEAARELHRVMAEHLVAAVDRGLPADRSVLADHVAAAGRALPVTPSLAPLLHDEAVRSSVHHPGRAAVRHRAGWWHAGPGADRERLQSDLVRLLVRSGRHDDLAALLEDVAAQPGGVLPAARTELGQAATLAALHRGRRVPPAVRAALDPTGSGLRALALSDRWFSGEPLRLDDVTASFAGFTSGWPRRVTGASTVRRERSPTACPGSSGPAAALRERHLVPVFEWLFGPDYGPPVNGPAGAADRVARGYAGGLWDDAAGAARGLATDPRDDPHSVELAVLLAAEMCTWRGEHRGAAAWAAELPADSRHVALRGWVECGAAYRGGDADRALEIGWSACSDPAGGVGGPGGWRLLQRMATIAAVADRPHWRRRLLGSIELHRGRHRDAAAQEAELLVQGLLHDDERAAAAGARRARQRGHRPDAVWAGLAAGLVATDPEPWLREAHLLAQEIGATGLRAEVRQVMDRRGVPVPAVRGRAVRFTPGELRIIDLIRQSRTNRQIALAIQVSEKTVENHLTKLFLKVGCRTRHGLAAASLDGRLEAVGA